MKAVDEPSLPPSSGPPSAARPTSEAVETSKLVLELIHAAYATRDADAVEGAGHGTGAPASPHAIRAAIHVYQHGTRTVGEIATGLGISYGWASRVVAELEASGMATRTGDPSDRRVAHISLAPDAVAVVEGAYRWRGEAIDRALDGLDERERAAVRTFLRRIVRELAPSEGDGPKP